MSIVTAKSTWQKTVGYIGRAEIPPGEAMLFPRCASIHTFFMRVPIDVVFLDGERRVVRMVPHVVPWRPYVGCAGAAYTLEMRAGEIERRGITLGDAL
jgi:uncharacterized membrane protein (UPF0127 family)